MADRFIESEKLPTETAGTSRRPAPWTAGRTTLDWLEMAENYTGTLPRSARSPDRELRLLMALGRMLPALPHSTAAVNRILRPWYLRKRRESVLAQTLGSWMELDPHQAIDAVLLFSPQLYDREELGYLRARLTDGCVFVDIGAYIGLYSLAAAQAVGPAGRVLAIEPNPESFEHLVGNIALNTLESRVTAVRVAASDREERFGLTVPSTGNRGGTMLVAADDGLEEVSTAPLATILERAGCDRPDGAKLDIEGSEMMVLRRWFDDVAYDDLPGFLIIETVADPGHADDIDRLLKKAGYALRSRHFTNAWNAIYEKSAPA